MSTMMDYSSDWKSRELTCSGCGWKGTFDDGDVELYSELMDSSCPKCDRTVATISYPTMEQMRENEEKLSELERAQLEGAEEFSGRFLARSLKSPDELPSIDEDRIELVWDHVEADVVIRHGDRVLWREPACWEGYERFEEVVAILVQKYGSRLRDLSPTSAAGLYLYGDRLSAIGKVQELRDGLRRATS